MLRKLLIVCLLLLVVIFIYRSFSFSPELVSFSGPTMGTTYTVKLYTNEKIKNANFIKSDIDEVLYQVNKSMSTYDPASELSLFNQAEIGYATNISSDLAYVINEALFISEQTVGVYDVTVGPLSNLWGFGPNKQLDRVPSEEEIESAKKKVGYHFLTLESLQLTKSNDIYVDLSSIAKGYGVDMIARKLDQLSIDSYLIEVGGEIRTKGVKEDGNYWRVAIEGPNGGHNVAQRVIELHGVSIATSGDYRNYFEVDGVRYSHLINPKVGKPITHKLVSVTVIAKNATLADGYSTAISILGADEGLIFAEKYELSIYMLVKTDFGFIEKYSSKFESYLDLP